MVRHTLRKGGLLFEISCPCSIKEFWDNYLWIVEKGLCENSPCFRVNAHSTGDILGNISNRCRKQVGPRIFLKYPKEISQVGVGLEEEAQYINIVGGLLQRNYQFQLPLWVFGNYEALIHMLQREAYVRYSPGPGPRAWDRSQGASGRSQRNGSSGPGPRVFDIAPFLGKGGLPMIILCHLSHY